MTGRVIRCALSVEDSRVERAAVWTLQSLLAPTAARLEWVAAGTEAELGYGCTGTVCSLEHRRRDWDAAAGQPVVDVLARAFWWLARVEELDQRAARDVHGRFVPQNDDWQARPVDRIARDLWESLGLTVGKWNGKKAAIAVTHDIDHLARWPGGSPLRSILGASRSALRLGVGHAFHEAFRGARAYRRWRRDGRDEYANWMDIVEWEREFGARSTFYVLARHSHPNDGAPDVYEEARGRMLVELAESGWEVGLHGSYTASESEADLRSERVRLESMLPAAEIAHQRFHYLRHDPPSAWASLDRIGFETDSSLGHPHALGPRSGFSFPYHGWDCAAGKPLDLVVVPILAMDTTWIERSYLGLSPDSAWEALEAELNDTIRVGGGLATVWHNNRLIRGTPWEALFRRFLQWTAENGVWAASIGDIAAEWRRRVSAAPTTVA